MANAFLTNVRDEGETKQAVGSEGRRLTWALAWLLVLPLAVLRAGVLAETDTFWQVRTGLLTLTQHAIPRVDPFSWTARGEPWTLNSWGYNVIVATAYRVAGLPGVALTGALFFLATAGLILVLAKRLGSTAWMAGASLLLVSPLLIPWMSVRPQIVDYVAVLLLLSLLLRVVIEGRAQKRSVLAVGVLSATWVNLHSAALLGVTIVGVLAACLLVRPATRVSGYRCLAAAGAALAGSLLNPYGIRLFTQTAAVKSASTDVVVEWQHLDPTSPTQLVMFFVGLGGLIIAVRRGDIVLTSALGVTAAGSLIAIRMLPILVILAIPVIAAAASRSGVATLARRMRLVLVPGAVVAVASMVALAVPSLGHIGQPDPALYPTAVVQQIPAGCRVFNSYLLGGFVLLKRPDVSVSIDSRNDFYGAEKVIDAARLLDGEGDPKAGLAGAGCVLVPPSSGLARELDSHAGWRLQASDPAGALFVRS